MANSDIVLVMTVIPSPFSL